MSVKDLKTRRMAALDTPSGLSSNAARDIAGALTTLLADMFALYMKTKNFHWHMSGPHFRDYHLMLDEQSAQIFATTDVIAERARKLGGTTLRSIGHIARLQRVLVRGVGRLDMPPGRPPQARPLLQANALICVTHANRELHRNLDRRSRAAHLVSVRSEPPGRRTRSLKDCPDKSRWPTTGPS